VDVPIVRPVVAAAELEGNPNESPPLLLVLAGAVPTGLAPNEKAGGAVVIAAAAVVPGYEGGGAEAEAPNGRPPPEINI